MKVALKQRLVGASVIIALAVIFIPMMFDNTRVSQNQSISIDIPDEPEGLKRKVVNIDTGRLTNGSENNEQSAASETSDNTNSESLSPDQNLGKIDKQETIIDMVDNSIDKPDSETPEIVLPDGNEDDNNNTEILAQIDKQESTDNDKDVQETVPPINQISKPVIRNYVEPSSHRIKYGVFSQHNNAQQLKAKIINSGYTAIVEKDNETNMFTVFSKEFATEADAQKVSNMIQDLKLNIGKPSILSFDEINRDTADLLLDTGWIIQIGSFASKVNSIKLRDKIRNKGFVSFVDEIINSKKQKRYRVRIGPYATRDEAVSEQNNVNKAMNLKGLIKPHEKQKVVLK